MRTYGIDYKSIESKAMVKAGKIGFYDNINFNMASVHISFITALILFLLLCVPFAPVL